MTSQEQKTIEECLHSSSISFIKEKLSTLLSPTDLEIKGQEQDSINNNFIKEITNKWFQFMQEKLNLSDKLLVLDLKKNNSEKEILKHLDNWFKYQMEFLGVPETERRGAYLYGKKMKNFIFNFDRFDDSISSTIAAHKQRRMAFHNKPISYGFSSDPIEDRKLAEENELQEISFCLLNNTPYKNEIIFPSNAKYYEAKLKKSNKEKN